MNTTTLQIPLSKTLKNEAKKVAKEQGFSSLQEMVRIFLAQLAAKTIHLSFERTVQLSPGSIKRYDKMIDEVKSGKVKTVKFDNIDEMMRYLK